jgi:hypothetical protein
LSGTARETLDTQKQAFREGILRTIHEAVATKAKAAGYALVVDTSARSAEGTLVILYSNRENDLSDEILSQLNKGAPAEFLKPTEAK